MALAVLVLLVLGIVVEVWVATVVADLIGWLPVVLLVIAGGLLGSRVLSRGALHALRRVAEASSSGERVGRRLADAALVVLSGFLLLVPGLVSGALGLLLLVPPVRAAVRSVIGGLVVRRLAEPFLTAARRGGPFPGGGTGPWGRPGGGPGDVEGHATERRPGGPGRPAGGPVLPAPPRRDADER